MKRVIPGLVVVTLLSGCPMPGLPWFQAQGGPSLVKRIEADHVDGRHNMIPYHLTSLLEGQMPSGRFTLEVEDFEDTEKDLINKVFPDYRSAIAHAEAKQHHNFLPSADQVGAITKQVNDGLYARFELALERGEGGFPAKPAWIRQLLDAALKDTGSNAKLQLAARLAGGLKPDQRPALPADVASLMQDGLTAFDNDPVLSKPISFFTWNDDLRRVFTRDRWLQGWFGQDKRAWIVRDDGSEFPEHLEAGIHAASLLTPAIRPGYDKTLTFYRRMTNAFSGYSPLDLEALLPAGQTAAAASADEGLRNQLMATIRTQAGGPPLKYWAVLPPSTSPESELFFKLDSLGQLPPGADRMQVLIDHIRQGKLSLAPKADSGYYAYQQYALESLLKVGTLPEAGKVTYGQKYQKRLEEAFKTGLTKARETHAKQLDLFPVPTSAAPVARIPWVVEPLPTYYERQADGYAFLKEQILPLFDAGFLDSTKTLSEGGRTGTQSLRAALTDAEQLMRGLAALAKAEIGLSKIENPDAAQLAADWIKDIGKDERLGVDTRVAVPVNQYLDGTRKMVQYWGTAGVTLTKVKVDGQGDQLYLLATDKFIFFDRPYDAGPLDREEYRAILDGSATLDEALKKLQGQ